jgi:hypothetical protein
MRDIEAHIGDGDLSVSKIAGSVRRLVVPLCPSALLDLS